MGLGDNLMATGMARGAAARGKRIAFGPGHGRTCWDKHSATIFANNPSIARPGTEHQPDVEWIDFRKGNRLYNRHDPVNDRWIWSTTFRPVPGEMFFTKEELGWAEGAGPGFVPIEPNVERWKRSAPNKQWPVEKFEAVADTLRADGHDVVQFGYGDGHRIAGARLVKTPTFRHALAVLARAALYIGPEGGLHHGAAAVGTPAIVLFGGFAAVGATGYDMHTNLTGGAEACGSLRPCQHCRDAMNAISADEVIHHARQRLGAE